MIWNNPIMYFFINNLFTNKLLKYGEHLRLKYDLNETQKEIEVLEKEILYVDHLRWNEKDNDHLKLLNKWIILHKNRRD